MMACIRVMSSDPVNEIKGCLCILAMTNLGDKATAFDFGDDLDIMSWNQITAVLCHNNGEPALLPD